MAENYLAETLLTVAREGLRDIGYQDSLLRREYSFADILAQNQPRRIDLAAFAQDPPSYRNACIGIEISSDISPKAFRDFRSLGAPQLLTLHPRDEKVLRWKVRAKVDPELIEVIDSAYLRQAIQMHQDQWNPEQVLRAKTIRFSSEPTQFDFYDVGLLPVIEELVYKKLDRLLKDVLATCRAVYKERHETNPDDRALFRLIFRLIAAKLLGDRQHPGNWLSWDVQEVIKEVDAFYFHHDATQAVLDDIIVKRIAWSKIREAFSFQNISVEALAYVYENTLVSPDIRKKQGIHATAHLIAEYILQKLPIDELDYDERRIFEPFAGHAPFLTAALGRLRSLLPLSMSTEQRHDYFIRMLSGMEYDAFASEVARYSLILADYPNPNGWRIETSNVFTSSRLNKYLAQASVVLCNPPYEDLTLTERHSQVPLYSVNKAVEALSRVLEEPPRMLGFVLPRIFTDGQKYAEVRKRIVQLYNNISIFALPDNTFNYSKAETVLLIAYREERTTQSIWNFASVNRADYRRFTYTGEPTWQVQAPASFVNNQVEKNNPNLWYTPMQPIWDALEYLPRMEHIAYVQRGIEYNIPFKANESLLVSDEPKEGFVKGLRNVTEDFEPYIVKRFTYLNIDPRKMLYEAYKLPWEKPKVITNAVRISSDRWLIAGVVDESGLVCYQNFHGIWPTGDIPLEIIAALLNSPIANAFLSSHRATWHNRKDTINKIPIPILKSYQKHLIVSLVHEYMNYRREWFAHPEHAAYFERRCQGIIRQIDGELLTAYNLPLHLEQDLLRYFEGYKRPGPIFLTQVKPSPTRNFHTSIIRVENIRTENGNGMIDAVIINWNPHEIVHIPISLIPTNLQERLSQDTRLVAKVNVGVKKAEDLIFEDFKLASEPKLYDELA